MAYRALKENVMKKDIYSQLSVLAMVAVPIAPAFYFGFDVAKDVYDMVFGWLQNPIVAGIFAALIGLGAVIGLELVGILSGHNIVKYFSLGMNKIAAVCGFILVAYVALGIVGLEEFLAKGVVMFLTAPLVYVLASMQQTAVDIHTRQDENEQAKLEWELAEKAKDNELNRQLRAEKTRAKIQPKQRQEERRDSGRLDTLPADWRQLTRQQRHELAHLTREERDNIMPEIATRTRRDWHKKLDEIAVQNGHFMAGEK
jgi:hypothetical protein